MPQGHIHSFGPRVNKFLPRSLGTPCNLGDFNVIPIFRYNPRSLFPLPISGDTSKRRSNVFEEILTPTRHHSRNPNPLQLELHFASQADNTRATALLNNMRVVCVFDLLLAVKDFLLAYDSQAAQGKKS